MMRVLMFALFASSATAQTFPFAGVLETADGPVDDVVDITLSIVAADGASLWTETQSAVVVVDGIFVVDVGEVTPLPASMPAASQLALTIDDDELAPIPLARLVRATGATNAARVETAATANSLAGVTAAAAATRAQLAAAGGPPVDFSNIAGVPATVVDGDQGTDVTGTSIDLSVVVSGSTRTLNIATVSGTRVAPAAINGSLLVAGSPQVANSAVTGAKVADRAITRANLVEDVTAVEVKTVSIFIQDHAACGSGFTTGHCRPASCGAGKQVECNGTGCSSPAPFAVRQCFNVNRVGELVVEQ